MKTALKPALKTKEIEEIVNYLRKLAPSFFAKHMHGASEGEIAQVEAASGASMSKNHREFLKFMGATPIGRLNPFLKDRGFSVKRLLAFYADIHEEGERLPPNVVLFSTPEHTENT